MPKSIAFEDYRRADISAGFTTFAEHEEGHADDRAWLSSFNIPTSVYVTVEPPSCTFNFKYSDNERPEPKARTLPGFQNLQLTLGKHTKKLLQIKVPDAYPALKDKSQPVFDSRLVWALALDLPDRNAKILTRNAQVVGHIVNGMPTNVRKLVLRRLRAAAKVDSKKEDQERL